MSAAHADQATINTMTKLAKDSCLVGTQFYFNASANGNITFRDPTKPGGQGEIKVDAREGTGAVAIFSDNIRVVADQQIRDCMHPYVMEIFTYIKNNPAPPVTRIIKGQTVGSHAGDPAGDGNDALACVYAEDGWSIVPNSGSLVQDGQPANGSIGITNTEYNSQHFCVTYHIIRTDRGRSAQANAHAQAVQSRPAP
ncbi:hypothetical protein [Azospirillum soli]|uniref:hypothetical protein n=1 Tax=Azospirillum soli TaxID=1304799 RepID=UPI001AE21F67|nr:hypothetical protein [Azospirillum soli]MBP2315463.1 hypothetical protein [Azospirillum soli]